MIPSTAPPVTPSPLRSLDANERAIVIRILSERLPTDLAVTVLAALAGAPEEVAALPPDVQDQVEQALLDAFPDGINAVVVSTLGINNVPSSAWIPPLRAKFASKTVPEAIAAYRRLEAGKD